VVHKTRAQTGHVEIAASIIGAKIFVGVLIVSLKHADRQVVVKERRCVVHATAGSEYNAPGLGVRISANVLTANMPANTKANTTVENAVFMFENLILGD